MKDQIIKAIKEKLIETDPHMSEEDISRRDRILNSDNPNFKGYGHKMKELEKIAKDMSDNFTATYEIATEVFKALIKSDIHEEKFVGIYFLNRFKKDFSSNTLDLYQEQYGKYCDTWALCDSSTLKVIGPFLGKKGNEQLAIDTINSWSNDEAMWIRRASLVILLKLVLMRKKFDESYVFELVEKMLPHKEDYVQKGIGWLLKVCSQYEPDVIIKYLEKNKKHLSRLIHRYASEKLPKDIRARILKK